MMNKIQYFEGLEVFFCGLNAVYTRSYDQSWPELFSVQFLHRGAMLFGRDGASPVRLEAPMLYWIEPAHHYFLSGIDGDDARHVVLFRGPAGARLLTEGFARLQATGFVGVDRPGEVAALFQALNRVLQSHTPATQPEAFLLLQRILLLLSTPTPATPRSATAAIAAAARYLREHACEKPEPAAVARAHGLSYSHFRKCFRDQIGRSPHDYVLHFQAQAAAAMLSTGDVRIKEVALACGYRDPAEFSRAFRRRFGVSPALYRRLVGSSTGSA